jgi:hypothetical protein
MYVFLYYLYVFLYYYLYVFLIVLFQMYNLSISGCQAKCLLKYSSRLGEISPLSEFLYHVNSQTHSGKLLLKFL